MKNFKNLSVIVFSSLFFMLCISACQDEIEKLDEDFLGFEYYPLEVGKYWVYEMDSITYMSGGQLIDTSKLFVKEEIVEILEDNNGDSLFRIERFLKYDLNDVWGIKDVWTASKNHENGLKTEENLKFVKFVFPPVKSKTWDGNIFFDENINIAVGGEFLQVYKNWNYKITDIESSVTWFGTSYNDVVSINQVDNESQLERRFSEEKYAKGIGLIYKRMIILDTQCIEDCIGMSWEEKGHEGFIIQQNLIDHN